MKTVLNIAPHEFVDGANVVEVRFNGKFVATIAGADDKPGIRIIGRRQLKITPIVGNSFGNPDNSVKITEIALL